MSTNKLFNFGVLTYKNSDPKTASSNIGDYVQSLAAINIYKKVIEEYSNTHYTIDEFIDIMLKNNFKDFNFIFINRDNIADNSSYKNYKNVIVIMNGWWMHPENNGVKFRIPDNVIPIFDSFHIANNTLYDDETIKVFKKFEPIGCRDLHTTEELQKRGVHSYFSGCLTSTIDFYKWNNQNNITYVVDTVTKTKNNVVKVKHCLNKYKNADIKFCFNTALNLLKNYSKSKNVITSRLHCFVPCLGMGIPVTFVSPEGSTTKKEWGSKNRFNGLKELKNKEYFLNISTNLQKNVIFKIKNNMKNIN